MRIRERHSSRRRGVRKWLTAAEMDERFGPELEYQMRMRKLLDKDLSRTEVRRHPDLPESEADDLFESMIIVGMILNIFENQLQ